MIERLGSNSIVNEEGDIVPIYDDPDAMLHPTNREIIRGMRSVSSNAPADPEASEHGAGVAISLVERAFTLERMMAILNQQAQALGRADKLWRGDEKQRAYFHVPLVGGYEEYHEYIEAITYGLLDQAEEIRSEFQYLSEVMNRSIELRMAGLPEGNIMSPEEAEWALERELAYPAMFADQRLEIVEAARKAAGLPPLKPQSKRKK